MGDIEKEIDAAFHEEGERMVLEEIESIKRRIDEIENLKDVSGMDGLADAMPLGEAIMCIGEILRGENRIGEKELTVKEKEKLERARNFLSELNGEEYPEGMELGAVLEKLNKEQSELLEKI